jgi:hypothetical protein
MLSAMSKNKEAWKSYMIKTLRITSIIAVVLAVVFFVFPAVFGVRGDKQIEQFLNSAGVIEQFKEAKGDKVKDNRQEISPLVKQAEAFALYLNPPPEPKTEPSVSRPRSEPRPKSVSPKFRVVGTSRHALHPELSLALIDEPGKGCRWVRQFSKVGRLIIEQVKDGLVVVRDGESTFELVAERPKKRSLLKKDSSSPLPQGRESSIQMSVKEETALTREREKALAELDALLAEMGLVEDFQMDVEPNEADLAPEDEEITEAKERQRSASQTMRISAEEAERLGRLGRGLKENVQRGPNRVEDDRTESNANLIEPNRDDVNISG